MRKILIISLTIVLTVVIGLTVLSCNDSVDSGYSLVLVENNEYKEKGYFEFTVGEIDWTAISFILLDESGNSLGEAITASQSMIYGDDLYKLTSAGTKTVTIHYQGASLQVTFKLNNPVVIQTYNATFNAGEGYFEDTNSSVKIVNTDVITAIPRPVRDGYDFQGWYEDEYYTGVSLITPYSLKKDMSFYAKWSDKRKYNVSYERFKDGLSDGIVSSISNVEYGTTIELIKPESIIGYDFTHFEVINDLNETTIIEIDDVKESYTLDVTSNLEIKLSYSTKIITLTFISEAWTDGEIVNGVPIVGGVYKKQVKYGTELSKNIDPIPVLPSKVGHTGIWMDTSTQKEPVYTIATENITVVANYTIIKFTMSFFDENGVLIENMNRYVDYGSYIDVEPPVPNKTGYDGYWTVLVDGHYVSVPLETIKMVDNVEAHARYTPKKFDIKFHYRLDGMSEDYVETHTYSYGDVINRPVDLTVSKVINGVEYAGYDSKYYEILWYASSSLIKQVTFPLDVVKAADYYYKVVARPYTVDFRVPEIFANSGIEHVTRSVKVGDRVEVPTWIIEGYNIIGWYYTQFAPYYDAEVNYLKNDIVFYNNNYYIAKEDSVGVQPDSNSSYWTTTVQNRKYYTTADIANGILVSDFHEYNEDKYYDRAFYPIYQEKQIPVSFYSLNIGVVDGEYQFDYSLVGEVKTAVYGTVGIQSLVPSSIPTPVYPDGRDSRFIFDGWYLESEFVTLPVDLSTLVLKDEIVLYAKWTDELVGTDGLEYTPYEIGENEEIVSYQVSGFNTTLAEYSHVILRIPENYNGKPVVAIADYAFADFSKVLFVDEVIIPSTIVEIGDNAFASCYGLSSFNVGNNSNFATDAYGVLYSADYTKLIAVALANEEFVKTDSYTIPQSVIEIAGGAFAGASNLKNVTFEGLNYSDGEFVGTSSLVSIGSYAFDACYNLLTISIPNSVTTIGKYAFRDCVALNNINIDADNSSLYKVGQNAFEGCENALDNETNSDFLLIGNVMVKYLGDAENLILLDNIVAIADGAFDRGIADENESNYILSSLYVNASSQLAYIGNKVFLSCSNLNSIHLMNSVKVEIEEDSFDGIALNAKLYVKNSLLTAYTDDSNYASCFGKENIISE